MSQAPRTPAAPPTMVLRLSVPAGSGFQAFASELAVKVAEYLGFRAQDASSTAASVDSLIAGIDPHDDKAEITFEFHQVEGQLRIEVHCAGRSSEARHPLPT
jgi:hypothetical protein